MVMKLVSALTLGAFAAVLPMGGVFAAVMITVPTSTPAEMPIHEAAGFDWSGFYAGIYGGAQNGAASGTQYGLGVQAGVNAQFDFYLLGAEVAVHGLAGGSVGDTSYGQILGRAGLVVSDDMLVYAAGGYGIDLGPPNEQDVMLGGGIELAVTDSITVEAQYLHGFPLAGGNGNDQFTFGANFHF
jgi:outer membrane immunogenic protein